MSFILSRDRINSSSNSIRVLTNLKLLDVLFDLSDIRHVQCASITIQCFIIFVSFETGFSDDRLLLNDSIH